MSRRLLSWAQVISVNNATGGGRLYAVLCGKQHCHWGIAGANGLAGRCLSLDMRR